VFNEKENMRRRFLKGSAGGGRGSKGGGAGAGGSGAKGGGSKGYGSKGQGQSKSYGQVDILRQGGDIKKKNPCIEHVRKFAKDNGVGYFKALSDPRCKSTYKKI
jgi:hypothetical protein